MKQADKEIAEIIYNQMGGSQFKFMTRASLFVVVNSGWLFRLPTGLAKDGINLFKIILNQCGTYTMIAEKSDPLVFGDRGITLITNKKNIYAEDLQDEFLNITGINTTFPKMVVAI